MRLLVWEKVSNGLKKKKVAQVLMTLVEQSSFSLLNMNYPLFAKAFTFSHPLPAVVGVLEVYLLYGE